MTLNGVWEDELTRFSLHPLRFICGLLSGTDRLIAVTQGVLPRKGQMTILKEQARPTLGYTEGVY